MVNLVSKGFSIFRKEYLRKKGGVIVCIQLHPTYHSITIDFT